MKKNIAFHPFLFGIAPLLFLYNHNIGQITLRQILLPGAVIVLLVLLFFLLLNFILKHKNKTQLIVSLFVILFFSYGYFYQVDSTWSFSIASLVIGINKVLSLLWLGILFVGSFFIVRAKSDFVNLNKIINVMAITLVALSLFNILKYQISSIDRNDNPQNDVSIQGAVSIDQLPDIYYIVFDEYAGIDTLDRLFGYDNSPFLSNLEDRGFYVARDSRSNYMQTYLSLASSLNMEYINYLTDELGESSTDWGPVHDKVRKSKVWQLLKGQGYDFYNFRSGYGPSNFFQNYDLNFQASHFGLDEFSMTLLQTTAVRPFIESSYKDDKRERVLYTFEKLPELADNDVPIFVLAHIVSPHSPYVFGANGEEVLDNCDEKNEDGSWSDFRKQCYIDETIFINKKIEEVVDGILAKSNSEAIIIVQSDHGSKTDGFAGNLTDQFKKERAEILNAYYLPGGIDAGLYESISPVNTFRLILNSYFGYNYDILPDQSYYSSQARPFDFINITGETNWESLEI